MYVVEAPRVSELSFSRIWNFSCPGLFHTTMHISPSSSMVLHVFKCPKNGIIADSFITCFFLFDVILKVYCVGVLNGKRAYGSVFLLYSLLHFLEFFLVVQLIRYPGLTF